MKKINKEKRQILSELFKILFLVLFISGVAFLYLLQRVRGREIDIEVKKAKLKRAGIVKEINELDYQIEQLKNPARIIPLAIKRLGMMKLKSD